MPNMLHIPLLSIPSIWDFLLRQCFERNTTSAMPMAFNSLNLGFPSATRSGWRDDPGDSVSFQLPQSGISFCDLRLNRLVLRMRLMVFQFPQSGISFCDQAHSTDSELA